MGAALRELTSKLSRDEFLESMTGAFLPIIVFMTDGFANDDWEKALAEAEKNNWFRKATRIGFAIGTNPDVDMIARLAGTKEAVIRTDDLALFAKLLRFASVSSSMLVSQSNVAQSEYTGASAVRQALSEEGVNPAMVIPGYDPSAAVANDDLSWSVGGTSGASQWIEPDDDDWA
jgi:uncharacterized protein YegL